MGEAAQARGARSLGPPESGSTSWCDAATVTVRDAAWQIMKEAYLKASANGTLPAHARQIMYAARPHIQATADRDLGSTFDQYFTQQLLPEYIEEDGRRLERRL